MSDEQLKEVIEALSQFVIRASKKGATQEEIAVLPGVAEVLLRTKITWVTLDSL